MVSTEASSLSYDVVQEKLATQATACVLPEIGENGRQARTLTAVAKTTWLHKTNLYLQNWSSTPTRTRLKVLEYGIGRIWNWECDENVFREHIKSLEK